VTEAVGCRVRFLKPKLDSMLRFAITDRFLFTNGDTGPLIERCGVLAQSGIDFILIREKDLPAGQLVTLCREILTAVRALGATTQVIVSSRVDVAIAAHLDGVHLSSHPGELTPDQVHQLMPDAFVSVSCHTLDKVVQAKTNGASAILFAPIFGKMARGAEVAEGVGLDRLREACEAADKMPVLALGGVTHANAMDCSAAGAAGVAGIRLFFAPTTEL
jgi:thiamine-phosphate pyrophosphorylase